MHKQRGNNVVLIFQTKIIYIPINFYQQLIDLDSCLVMNKNGGIIIQFISLMV